MPIYEFYCPDCHMIFNFLSARIDTETKPDCPRCGRPRLERRVSLFTVVRGVEEENRADVDETAVERAVSALAGQEEAFDSNDPRQAARAMREFYRVGGLDLGPGAEEYLRRLESGQDPEEVDQELGHLLDEEDPFVPKSAAKRRTGRIPPARDQKLYSL